MKRDLAKSISSEEHAEAMKRLDIYKDWLLENILQPSKKDTLLVLPITSQEVDYRENPRRKSSQSALMHSSLHF